MTELLFLIDTAYDHVSWHGTNLRGSLRGVSLRQATWRPRAGRHNIWELAVHAAYWKYAVWRRLAGGERGSFPLGGSNWLVRPEIVSVAAWRRDLGVLEQMHRALRGTVAGLDPRALDRSPDGGKVTARALVSGIAAHDFYHAGQIQLLKRLAPR